MAALGAEVVAGDLDDAASVERALEGAWGVFAVQNTWEAGVEKEEEQGKRLAKLAREAGVQRFVYTSVGSAHKTRASRTSTTRSRVEQTVQGARLPVVRDHPPGLLHGEPAVAVVRCSGDKLIMRRCTPTTKLQMIAVDDIGRFGAKAFAEADTAQERRVRHRRRRRDDARGRRRASSPMVGKTLRYQQIPMAAVRQNSEDFAKMLEWFESTGYSADIASLEKRFGIRPLTLTEWVRKGQS